MRKGLAFFLTFLIVTCLMTFACIYATEKTDCLHLKNYQIETSFHDDNGHTILTWQRYPYPCFYKVVTYYKTTGNVPESPQYREVASEYTFGNSYQVPGTAIPAYYKVIAYGVFGQVSSEEILIPNANYGDPLKPVAISKYDSDNPASLKPYILWHSVPDCVLYELELLSGPPDHENTTVISKTNHVFSTQQVFTNGLQIDLTPYAKYPNLYWRVRAMNLKKEPIGVFSDAEPITIDANKEVPNKPLLNNFDRMANFRQPVYPVYTWIPMLGAVKYEVELMVHKPAQENNTEPTADRAWAKVVGDVFSCYDEYPRYYGGEYYWRVRGLDANGNTVGVYSDTDTFTVPVYKERPLLATFGDSITHGGGAVSFSPANLEYSYDTYLDIPAINIGRSGDTSETSLKRFETDVLPIRPRNLIIMTGSNSLRASHITAKMVIDDLDTIVKKCQENDIRPILLTLPPVNPANIMRAFRTPTDPNWFIKMQTINKYIRSQQYYIDLEPYFYDNTHTMLAPQWANDGLHADIQGKMLMAEIINQHLDLLDR